MRRHLVQPIDNGVISHRSEDSSNIDSPIGRVFFVATWNALPHGSTIESLHIRHFIAFRNLDLGKVHGVPVDAPFTGKAMKECNVN